MRLLQYILPDGSISVSENDISTNKAWVQSLGWEDPLEEGMATHSNILAWRIPMNREAWQTTVYGVAESDMTERLSMHY